MWSKPNAVHHRKPNLPNRENGKLVGFISKLRSKTNVATTAIKVEADAKPESYEAADSEENSRGLS